MTSSNSSFSEDRNEDEYDETPDTFPITSDICFYDCIYSEGRSAPMSIPDTVIFE